MQLFHSVRLMLLALVVALVPASSFAGVFISVGFAPPVLPVYEQPPCPEPGLMWTPGYWAYGPDGYYWVPGAWVPVPYEGALWTPGYWGWSDGMYMFHPGYWGYHVGYYGGVNYGFGYMGIGFVGGMWRGRDFVYNTAVMHVDERFVHTTYVDRTIVERNTIANDRHVAFSGGPGGIRHDPVPEERIAENEHHMGATSFQHTHETTAQSDRGSYFRNNGGHPSTLAVQRPLGMQNHATPGASGGMKQGQQGSFNNRPGANPGSGMQNQQANPTYQNRQQTNPAYQNQQGRPAQQPQQPNNQPQQRSNQNYQPRPAQQAQPVPQPRSTSQPHPAAPGPAPSAGPKSDAASHSHNSTRSNVQRIQ